MNLCQTEFIYSILNDINYTSKILLKVDIDFDQASSFRRG